MNTPMTSSSKASLASRLRAQHPFAVVTCRPGGSVTVTDHGVLIAEGHSFSDMLSRWQETTMEIAATTPRARSAATSAATLASRLTPRAPMSS
jgi:hypothetical protein